jgi:hypothetical protein
MALLERLTSPGPTRILSLDGGGLRGVLAVEFLRKIELRAVHSAARSNADGKWSTCTWRSALRSPMLVRLPISLAALMSRNRNCVGINSSRPNSLEAVGVEPHVVPQVRQKGGEQIC